MFNFRQKIFITYLAVFLVFIGLMLPFASRTVKKIVTKAMRERATELIAKIQSAPDDEALVERLKLQKSLIFFRVSLVTNEHKLLYDSHTRRLLGPKFSQDYVIHHPEIDEAFREGTGYHEEYSELLSQKFVYIAIAFDFHGKKYVLRTAFPYQYVVELTHDFEIGFLGLASAVLLLFSIMTWFIINYLTRPIHQIITAVKPYQEGKVASIPEIKLHSLNRSDEFSQLANTLNSLSVRIRNQINTLTNERNEKESILESLVEGVVAVNAGLVITYANNMAHKLLNIEDGQLVGQSFSMTEQHKSYNLLARCQKEKKILMDKLEIKREGQKIYLDLVAAPTKGDTGAILVMQDKTSDHKMMQMRKDFVANASHELKTPITIVQGFAEALHDNPDLDPEMAKEVTNKIMRNCKRMTTLIKDLLTLSDIEHIPQSRLIDCDLFDLIQTCCNTVQQMYPEARIKIERVAEKDFNLTADPNLMEMAILNLIENAAKYSPSPAHITVTLNYVGKNIKIVIADKGMGIPKNDLEHIFDRFYTVNKIESRKKGGSGLGLSIVQTIISKHSGKISAQSEMGKGTSFTILLPYKKSK